MKKKVVSILLAGVLLFATACGGQTGAGNTIAQPQKGRYVETNIIPAGDESLLGVCHAADGSLVAYSEGMKTRYTSADGGKTWQEQDGPGAINPELESAQKFSLAEDGTLYVRTVEVDEAGGRTELLYKILQDGTVEPLAVQELDNLVELGKEPMLQMLEALPQNRLLLGYTYSTGSDGSGAELGEAPAAEAPAGAEGNSDAEGGKPAPEEETQSGVPGGEQEEGNSGGSMVFSGSFVEVQKLFERDTLADVAQLPQGASYMAAAADNEKLYLMSFNGEIEVYSLATGKQEKTFGSGQSLDNMDFSQRLAVGEDGSLYRMSAKGVFKMSSDGTFTKVLEPGSFAFAAANNLLQSMLALSDGVFVAQVMAADGKTAMYRYEYDAEATVDPAKTIEVWSYKENPTIRAAIAEYVRMYPDASVNYEAATTGDEDGAANADDIIKNLNTRILNGDGPDVIVLDGCPAESYADKGLLMDLAGKLDTSGLYAPVSKAYVKDSGMYYLPARFEFPVLMGTAEDIKKADNLNALVQMVEKGAAMPQYKSGEDMFSALPENERPVISFDTFKEWFDLLWAASSSKVVEKDGINSDNLRTFLQQIKAVSDKLELTKELTHSGAAMVSMNVGSGSTTLSGSPISYVGGRAKMGGLVMQDVFSSRMMDTLNAENKTLGFKSFPGLQQGTWLPTTMVGVSAATQKEKAALQFLQALLSEAVQGTGTSGFPVTQAGADKQIADFSEAIKENEPKGFDFDMDKVVSQMEAPVLRQPVLENKIFDVASKYCSGKMDLEEAMEKIGQELKNYLAERA